MLPTTDGPPQQMAIRTSATKTPAIGGLAMYVAPLLLTGKPVCVLDGDQTSLDERLRFIDTVMALLPYGFRARMTAATWTKSTYQTHRFRLYFSSAPRTDQQDYVVSWVAPDDVYLPPGHAREYYDWLADKVDPITRLADLSELSSDLKFDNTAATKALEMANSLDGRRHSWSSAQYPPQPSRAPGGDVSLPSTGQPSPSPQAGPVALDRTAEVLQECVDYIEGHNTVRLKSAAGWLLKQAKADSLMKQQAEADAMKRQAEADPGLKARAEEVDDRRKRYREQISDSGLLQPHESVGGRQRDLYGALLAVAFGRPLTYTGYCQVEKCLDGGPDEHPHQELLKAIKDGEMTFATKALVLYLTREERNEKDLNKWYASGELDPVTLVHWLAEDWGPRPHHARVICDLSLDFLMKVPARYDQASLRSALRRHGFLARALQLRHPEKEQYQISALYRFLRAAYSGTPGRQAIGQILAGASHPPTPALFAAVLMNLSSSEAIQFAQEAYVHGSLARMNMHTDTYLSLCERVPALDSTPYLGGETADEFTEQIMAGDSFDQDQS
jgi:hypothetical protein